VIAGALIGLALMRFASALFGALQMPGRCRSPELQRFS
jgi:hypothetical protein